MLEWVREKDREAEYEEVVEIKKNIKLKKLGIWERLWPMILPFFEIPARENIRNRERRRLRRALHHPLADPAPLRGAHSVVVVDEEDEEQRHDVVSANPPVVALHIPLPTIHECSEPSASSDNLSSLPSSSTAPELASAQEDSKSNIVASSSSASFVSSKSQNEPIDV